MVFEKVKQAQVIKTSLLVALLIALPRSISLINIDGFVNNYFSNVSFWDLILRFFAFFTFSLVVIHFNVNWKYQFPKLPLALEYVLVFLINILFITAASLMFRFLYPYIIGVQMTSLEFRFLVFILTVVLIILFFVARILRFQIAQKQSLIENEKLIQQNLQTELTALKNQVNPHFLFNSLNTLTSLVRENKPASDFIKKLSFMYRYILQSGEKDLVTIEEELKFLESYTYLIETRYRDRFTIDLYIEKRFLEKEIPPLALQILVENAVKHNEISETNPLVVSVYSEDNSILVKNEIRLRTTFVDSTGNGLSNLDKRYKLLKNQNIKISKDNNEFCVSLALN
jgi:two-component system LytT family sensor kinase